MALTIRITMGLAHLCGEPTQALCLGTAQPVLSVARSGSSARRIRRIRLIPVLRIRRNPPILRSRVAAISLAAARRVATTSRAAPRPPSRRPLRRLRRTARCLALATRPHAGLGIAGCSCRSAWHCSRLAQAFSSLGSSAQLDVLDVVEVDGDIPEFEQLECGERFVENAGAATIAVRIVIGDAHQVATFEALELF